MEVNIFKEAREIIRVSPDIVKREHLRACTDLCRTAYDLVVANPDRTNMRYLVASWTRLVQAIDAMPPIGGGDNSPAGRVPVPKAKAA